MFTKPAITLAVLVGSVSLAWTPAAAQEQPVTAEVAPPPPVLTWEQLPHEYRLAVDDLVEFLTAVVPGGIHRAIDEAAARYGVSAATLHGIIRCESRYNHLAVNRRSGASGLGQHMPAWYPGRALAAGFDPARIDPLRPRQNAHATAWLLATSGTSPWRSSRGCWS